MSDGSPATARSTSQGAEDAPSEAKNTHRGQGDEPASSALRTPQSPGSNTSKETAPMSDYSTNGGYSHRPSSTPGATPGPAGMPAPVPAPETVISVVRADQPQPQLPQGSSK